MSVARSVHLFVVSFGLALMGGGIWALFHQPPWMVSGGALTLRIVFVGFGVAFAISLADIAIAIARKKWALAKVGRKTERPFGSSTPVQAT
jgi:hypothetical protein